MMSDWWRKETDPVESFKALCRGERPDRVLVAPMALGFAAKNLGYKSLGEIYEFPKVWFKAQQTAMDMYQIYTPPLVLCGAAKYRIGAWGGKYIWPYGPKMGAPILSEPAAKKPEDVEKMEVPDPAPFMNITLEAFDYAIQQKWHPWFTMPAGWISQAGYSITEPETIMFWIHKQPDLVHKMLDMTADYGIRVAEVLVRKYGTESWMPWDANPTDSNTLISADMFAKFPLPRAIRAHQKVLDMGMPMWCTHWCANHGANIKAGYIEKVPQGEPGMLSFGPEVPMGEQVQRFGKRNIIMGNVDPPSIMTKSFDEVVELCKQNMELGMRAEKGYTLTAGCELPPPAPAANVYAMTKAARDFGRYK